MAFIVSRCFGLTLVNKSVNIKDGYKKRLRTMMNPPYFKQPFNFYPATCIGNWSDHGPITIIVALFFQES